MNFFSKLLLQWGKNADKKTLVNLPLAFSNIQYSFVFTPCYGGGTMGYTDLFGVSIGSGDDITNSQYRTTTTQKVGTHVGNWIATGT